VEGVVMIQKRDWWRPFFGLCTLQPPTILWCYATNVPYVENLGIFSVLATLYLIPMYAWYERKCDALEKDGQPVGWPY
jgi:hypothetical protein